MDSISDVRAEIVRICRRLYDKGLLAGADGNVSAKLDDGHIITTPTGAHKGFMDEDDLIVVNNDGSVIKGEGRPSSELAMHLAIYRADPMCRAIVHTHAPYALALSLSGTGFDAGRLAETEMLLGEVAEVPFAPPGTLELAEAAADAVPKGPVFILERHGAVSRGNNLKEAFQLMECLEHNARILVLTAMLERRT